MITEQVYQESIKTLNCKTSSSAYGVFSPSGQLLAIKQRPNICGVPFCKKCEKERQDRLMAKYKPYFDAYEKPHIRHLIATTPAFPRGELETNIKLFFDNIKRFHEMLRKEYGYPLRTVFLVEPHYQTETDSYNLHIHYGIFSHVDIRKFRNLWCQCHNNPDLVVKFPQRHGKPVFRTRKGAFLEYFTRRRAEQARRMPLSDYFAHVKNRQLIRRIGFNKAYLAMVTTIRKAQQNDEKLGEENMLIWLGNYDTRIKFERIEAEFRRRYGLNPDYDEEIGSLKAHVRRIFRGLSDITPTIAKQVSLNNFLPKKSSNESENLCIDSSCSISFGRTGQATACCLPGAE